MWPRGISIASSFVDVVETIVAQLSLRYWNRRLGLGSHGSASRVFFTATRFGYTYILRKLFRLGLGQRQHIFDPVSHFAHCGFFGSPDAQSQTGQIHRYHTSDMR